MFTVTLEPTKRVVMFKTLTFSDRRAVGKMYPGRQDGYTLEELLAAYALVQDNGHLVEEEWAQDPITRLDNWSLPETQFYMEVFMSICMLEDKVRTMAIETAKKLMGSVTSPAPTGTPNSRARKVDSGLTES